MPQAGFTLEALLTHPDAFGLITASPLQRAICRIADGIPLGDLASHPDVVRAIGDCSELPPGYKPDKLYVLSGIRTGKSLLAGLIAVRSALTCDCSKLRPGEPVRVSILSLKRDLGQVVFDHIVGTLMSKPALKKLIIGEPTTDSLFLRHPSGHAIEIAVVAGASAGSSLIARWSAGVIFDEAPRMIGEEEGVVNFDDALSAAVGRMLPGAQIVAIGSPWAPRGPIYDAVSEHWGKPTKRLVIVRAPAYAMNPVIWTREEVLKTKELDPRAFRTGVLCLFADPDTALISSSEIDRATRKSPININPEPLHSYVAAMDPATRGDAWTLMIVARRQCEDLVTRTVVVYHKQWRGTKTNPLDPDDVLRQIAGHVKTYACEVAWSDQLASDFVRSIASRHGLTVKIETVSASSKVAMFESLRMRIADNGVEIPDDPYIRADLLSIRKQVTMNGIQIVNPRTADGRHGDYASALALAASKCHLPPPQEDNRPVYMTDQWHLAVERIDQELAEQSGSGQAFDWLERLKQETDPDHTIDLDAERTRRIRQVTRGAPRA